jgi:iron complex transport system substrate-binding protein
MKIVSLLPSATEIVCSLGLEKSLVAVTHECDFPVSISHLPAITTSRISHETMTSEEIDHAVRSQLDGHGSIYDLDTKLLKELNPDLILTQELCDVCAVSYKQVESAAKMYVADATVVSLEPNTISDIYDSMIAVGKLADAEKNAIRIVDEFRRRIETIREKTSSIPERPAVFMLEWLEPPFAPGHWVPEQVEIAGGRCLLGEAGQRSVPTTYDAISESKPDVIVLVPCGYCIADTLRQLGNTCFPSSWRDIPALKNREVWAADATSYFSRPGPRVVEGIEILAKIFHPDLFGTPSEAEAVRVPANLIRFS